MMVKNFHQAPAEITTWWWVMKNQAWYAAELMSRCAGWSAIRAPGEWEEGRAARHMRNTPEALCDLDTKTGRPSCSPQKLCYGSSEKNCSWPKAAPFFFFSKMLEVFSLLPVKMKLHLLMISLLTEVAGWRQRFTRASCLPNAAGDTGGQRMV